MELGTQVIVTPNNIAIYNSLANRPVFSLTVPNINRL